MLARTTTTRALVVRASAAFSSTTNTILLALRDARLAHDETTNCPGITFALGARDHIAVVGENASGKSTFCSALLNQSGLRSGVLDIHPECSSSEDRIVSISFSDHVRFLGQHGHSMVSTVLGGLEHSQDLIVRFGLSKLWYKNVSALSTGEIRKVMLAHALSKQPRVLLLDRPFDGLDFKSRATLRWVIGDLARGMKPLLVSTVKFKRRPPTQLVIITHRPESELPSETTHVLHLTSLNRVDVHSVGRQRTVDQVIDTIPLFSNTGRPGLEHGAPPQPPNQQGASPNQPPQTGKRIVQFSKYNIAVQERNRWINILHRVDWTVRQGAHYFVAGANGAGKSTLMSAIVDAAHKSTPSTAGDAVVSGAVNTYPPSPDETAGGGPTLSTHIVSTNAHISTLNDVVKTNATCRTILSEAARPPIDASHPAILAEATNFGIQGILDARFHQVSQGQQKLVLIACGVLNLPDILILDEICQGLDPRNRACVLHRLRRLALSHPRMTTISITHHEDEVLPHTTHRATLEAGVLTLDYVE